jgi:galactokinase
VVTVPPGHEALCAAGLTPARATTIVHTLQQLDTRLRQAAAAAPTATLLVPGRIEVFGKHTDYAGGESLLCAVDRGFVLRVAPRPDPVLRILDAGRDTELVVPLSADAAVPRGSWGNYVATVIRRLSANFPEMRQGADIAMRSDLPSASGLSSSSALVIAIARALIGVNALDRTLAWTQSIGTLEDEAAYYGTIENGASFKALEGVTGVGTFGGSQDHAAIVAARPGALLHMGFAPVRRLGVLPLPADHCFVVAVSGVLASKTGAARARYNAVSALARRVVERWNQAEGASCATLADVLRSDPDAGPRLRRLLTEQPDGEFATAALVDRLAQFELEWREAIPAAVAALQTGDLDALGAAADASHDAAARWLRNQVPETMLLQRLARELGAPAASAFGAGFGGAVWALVPRAVASGFGARWLRAFRHAPGGRIRHRTAVFSVDAGPPLLRW